MSNRPRWLFLLPALCFILVSTAGVGLNAASRFPGPLSLDRFLESAMLQTQLTMFYDPSYVKLPYPGGDVPIERGVCTDVIVRSFRATGVDLQKLVHEDMKHHFSLYPKRWGLTRPDSNIDHRRVPNLETFFSRNGMRIADITPPSFRKGDLVVWKLPGGLPHIGIIATDPVDGSARPLCIHNVGAGTRLEDVLIEWPITAHYRCDFR